MAISTSTSSSGSTVNGTVESQTGAPIANATVIATAYDKSDYASTTSKALEEINDVQQRLRNPEPDAWESQNEDNFELAGDNGSLESFPRKKWVVAHTAEDWNEENILFPGGGGGASPFSDPDLTEPKGFQNDNYLPADEPIVLTPWNDKQNRGGLANTVENDIDEDLWGYAIQPQDSPKIVIEELSPSGDSVVSTTRLNVTKQFEAGIPSKDIGFVTWNPTPGFYRLYLDTKSSDERGKYVISVGKPSRNVQPYIEDLRTQQGNLVDVAQHYSDRQGNSTVTKKTVQTGAEGNFSIDFDSSIDEVDLIAYKPPTGLNTSSATRNDSRQYYQKINVSNLEFEGQTATINASDDFDSSGMPGSVYLPAQTNGVEPPADNVTVTMREYSIPPRTPPSFQINMSKKFEEWLRNRSYSQLPPAMQERLNSSNVSTAELVETYQQLRDLVAQDDRMETTYCNFLANKSAYNATCSEPFDPENATADQLIDRIDILQEVITVTRDEINEPEDPVVEKTNNTVSVRFPFDQDLAPENVVAKAIWSNGTTDYLNVTGPYLSIEDQLTGGDVVVISDYPLGGKDPNAVTFEVTVATPEGKGTVREVVKNPTFNGSLPALRSIDVSSLRPGPDSNVTFELNPVDPATVKDIKKLKVYGPDDEQVNASITGDLSGAFDTSGAGRYHVEVTYNGTENASFTETFRVLAGERDHDLPPAVRVVQSSISTFVLAGDGLSDGEISFQDGGQSATIVATVPEGADDPGEVFFYTAAADLAPDNELTVRIAKGAEQRTLSQTSLVTIRMASISEDALVWREDDALRQGAENRVGKISNNNSRTIVETFTQEDGSVTIRTNSNPSVIDRARHWIDFQQNRVDLPFVGAVSPLAPLDLVRAIMGWFA